MPEPIPEVQSAGSYGGVAPIAVAAAGECNTFRKVRLVQESPLFADIPPADCREIVSTARESEFSRHGTIFLEGDPIRHVTLLTSGSAKVTNSARMPRGLFEVRHCSMAQALNASIAMIWEASALEALVDRVPALRRNIQNSLRSACRNSRRVTARFPRKPWRNG